MNDTLSTVTRILNWWPALDWRHHGAGLLQAYMPAPSGIEGLDVGHPGFPQRVHIWHPALITPGIDVGGAKHNHRFHLRSTVLHGKLLHSSLTVVADQSGDHQLWRIEGASNRAQARLVGEERVRVTTSRTVTYCEGHSYALLKWDYHWARPVSELHSDVAITLVDMVEKEGSAGAPRKGEGKWARLVCPVGVQPVHAFEDDEEMATFKPFVGFAKAILEVKHDAITRLRRERA